ncbi:MAG TPA: TRAP transporter fused permease subunit [Rhizobiaceae bacterium]|nr:TRAP transporter fused permease subunit [Rhizobiaceae bacterium]
MAVLTAERGILRVAADILSAAVPILSIVWILSIPQRLALLVYPEQVAAVMLGAALAVVFYRNIRPERPAQGLLDLVLGTLSAGIGLYVYIRFPVLSEGASMYPTEAMMIGILATLLIMEGMRRVIGWSLIIIFAAMFLYALFGDYVPGPLVGRPQPLGDVLRFLGTDSTAIWGQSLQIAAFVVIVFVLFGGLLIAVGGGEFFTQLSMRVAGKGPGNTAKVAVTASALFGTVSGSAVSNVMSTGVMTIPLMKRAGFKPETAGAVEAVASTGGQLMPPIMGAAAFLMAELLQVPYREIMLAALLPAILYYLSVYVQIHFIAHRDDIPSLNTLERVPIFRVLIDGWLPLLSIVVLVFALFSLNTSAERAAVYAIGAIIAVGLAASLFTKSGNRLTPRGIVEAIVETGRTTCDIMLITAGAGMIIGLLTTTGLGFALSLYLLNFGGETLFGLLLVTAAVGIVLGAGLPTTGVYLLMASLAAPALTQLGIEPIAAHMFVFYFGMLSMISPPIAMASFAAASLAGSDQMKTSVDAFKLGWIAYVLPFLFIYKPGLLLMGSWLDIAYVFVSSVVALVLVTGGIVGHARAPLGGAARLLWTVLGLAMIAPLDQVWNYGFELAVSALGFVVLLASLLMSPPAPAPVAGERRT